MGTVPVDNLYLALRFNPGTFKQNWQRANIVGPKHNIDPRRAAHDFVTVLLSETSADCNLQLRILILDRLEVTQVPVQPIVCVLAHGAGIEDYDVRIGSDRNLLMSSGFQQPCDAFGVVHIHLTTDAATDPP